MIARPASWHEGAHCWQVPCYISLVPSRTTSACLTQAVFIRLRARRPPQVRRACRETRTGAWGLGGPSGRALGLLAPCSACWGARGRALRAPPNGGEVAPVDFLWAAHACAWHHTAAGRGVGHRRRAGLPAARPPSGLVAAAPADGRSSRVALSHSAGGQPPPRSTHSLLGRFSCPLPPGMLQLPALVCHPPTTPGARTPQARNEAGPGPGGPSGRRGHRRRSRRGGCRIHGALPSVQVPPR